MPRMAALAALLTTLAACGAKAPSGADAAGVRLATVAQFASPVLVTAAPGDTHRIYVVEQGGRVRIVKDGRKLAAPFLDVSSRITGGGEQGLLGLAFAPDFTKTKRFYVYYTDTAEQQRVVEYRAASRDRAQAGSARLVLKMADEESNHNGGMLVFGPDKLLYIGTGDGGSANDPHGDRGNAQNLGSPLGKILRIDPRRRNGRAYSVPASNPFVGRSSALGEIYSYGLRNPWRFSFDRKDGALVIGDVGQDDIEEIDYLPRGKAAGANFGWRPFEGNRENFDEPAPGHVAPVITHSHGDGWCSITGGYIVRDPALPELAGTYVYGDYCKGDVWAATLRPGGATNDRRLDVDGVGKISSFGEDARGRVYVVSLDGAVYRLVAR